VELFFYIIFCSSAFAGTLGVLNVGAETPIEAVLISFRKSFRIYYVTLSYTTRHADFQLISKVAFVSVVPTKQAVFKHILTTNL